MARKKNYVIGYKNEGNCVYGKEHFVEDCAKGISSPMTLAEATRRAKKVWAWNGHGGVDQAIVFKLVPVRPRPR